VETFREYLDHLCRTRNVLYAELARRIGVTKSYIGQLIHGHSKPPPARRVEQIAEALELSPAERQRLADLAVRERARGEARAKIEELDNAVSTLRATTADLIVAAIASYAREGEQAPPHVAQLLDKDDVLAAAHQRLADDPSGASAAEFLASVPPARLADALNALTSAAARPPEATPAPPLRGPDIPVIGYVAAGQTDVAFTDAGLPAGAGLPGEEPIPRWPGVGVHAYALRISGDSMAPLCPPGTTIVVDPDRTPHSGEPAICQTNEGKTYFKLVHFEQGGRVRLVSTNADAWPDILLEPDQVRRLQKVIATIYP